MARIPVPIGRVLALVVAAGSVAVVVVLLATAGGGDVRTAPKTTGTATGDPLPGLPLVRLLPVAGVPAGADAATIEALVAKEPARADLALALGAARLAAGDGPGAATAFARASALGAPEGAVGSAVAAYDPARPDVTIGALATLTPSTAIGSLARYEIGVVQLWAGRNGAAAQTLARARDLDPEGPYGVLADNLLHPTYKDGYPFFLPPTPAPAGSTIATLTAAAAAGPGDVDAQLALGAALLEGGRRKEATVAFRQAFASDPQSVAARVALAVASFSKDDPAGAIGAVGPLVRDNPDDQVPRFHLALMLYWIGLREKGRAEMSQVVDEGAGTVYGQLARQVIAQSTN